MITKPSIFGHGLNWQHCAHVGYFPDHSYEQWYQAIRRCWRFGQKWPVTVDVVTTVGEQAILHNLERKAEQADQMFTRLVACMNDSLHIEKGRAFTRQEQVPSWLKKEI